VSTQVLWDVKKCDAVSLGDQFPTFQGMFVPLSLGPRRQYDRSKRLNVLTQQYSQGWPVRIEEVGDSLSCQAKVGRKMRSADPSVTTCNKPSSCVGQRTVSVNYCLVSMSVNQNVEHTIAAMAALVQLNVTNVDICSQSNTSQCNHL
jgi:hypothetical protein